MAAYVQIKAAAKKAWNRLPSSKEQTEELSSKRQEPDELFQDFVSRLTQASNRLTGDREAGQLIVKQLAFENANTICKVALRSFRKQGDTITRGHNKALLGEQLPLESLMLILKERSR